MIPAFHPYQECTQWTEDFGLDGAEEYLGVTTCFFPEYNPYLALLYQSFGIKFNDVNNTLSCSDVHLDSEHQPRHQNVQDPYFSSRSYKIGSRTVTLPDLPTFSILNPFPLGRRILSYCRITRDYVRMLITAKEFMSKGRMMDIGKHPIERGNGRVVTLREFLEDGGYSHDFSSYFVPRIASICTCSFERMMEYPACVVLECIARCMPFGRMKALPSSGLQNIIDKLSDECGTVHYNTTIKHVHSEEESVVLTDSFGVQRIFDHVIFATPANQTATVLAGQNDKSQQDYDNEYTMTSSSASLESLKPEHPFYPQIKTLLKFPYERTRVICHTDTSFLPKDPSHWRSLNIAKPFSADILVSPLNKIAKELEQEMELRSRNAKSLKSSMFSMRSSPFSVNKLSQRRGSLSRLRSLFVPSFTFEETEVADNLPFTDGILDDDEDCYIRNSVMATYILNKTTQQGLDINVFQTINPIYLPSPDKVISSAWLDRVVVNPSSMKAIDELQHLMEQQAVRIASHNTEPHQHEESPGARNGATNRASDRVWFVGNYAYPGIPLLEGYVASALRVTEHIIASESTRQLTVPSSVPVALLWERSVHLRERDRYLRRESADTKKGSKRQSSLNSSYFKTAWKDEVNNAWLEQNKRYVHPFTFRATLEVTWIMLLYLMAITKWLMVFVIESFGGDGGRWAYT
ncbi:hypothetical protein BGZ46_009967 [Entomortierella lignicola]|nr:hypothetical protein BGZ46_009967 [Entomortierella lignicola]